MPEQRDWQTCGGRADLFVRAGIHTAAVDRSGLELEFIKELAFQAIISAFVDPSVVCPVSPLFFGA